MRSVNRFRRGHARKMIDALAAAYAEGRESGLREAAAAYELGRQQGLREAQPGTAEGEAWRYYLRGLLDRETPPGDDTLSTSEESVETATVPEADTVGDDPEVFHAQMSAYLAGCTGVRAGDFSGVDVELTFRAYIEGRNDADARGES